MSKLNVGTIYAMHVLGQLQNSDAYVLQKGNTEILLHTNNEYQAGDMIDVFIYKNKQGNYKAIDSIPPVIVGTYNWAEVVNVDKRMGVFISIGLDEPIIIFKSDLPKFEHVWPQAGDKLFITLKADSNDKLLAKIAKETDFSHLFQFAANVDLNEQVSGTVIRTDREGTVILTEEFYRGFIHYSEREKEPRLGEVVTGRVIEVKETGSLNVSLLPMKHERLDSDAEVIYQYLLNNDGVMNFSDKSNPDEIKNNFHMSKSAFKRALGRLMKAGKITQKDGKTYKHEKKL